MRERADRYNYDLCGPNGALAVKKRLAEAVWYQSPVPRAEMRKLLERQNWPGIRDCTVWFGLMGLFAWLTLQLWGSWWALLPYFGYAVLYGSTSDSRWHESSHGTVFKTDWLNNVLYEIASFMVMRESTVWRWSHTRHHSDTIVVGRDPEIASPRPVKLAKFVYAFTGIPAAQAYFKKILKHSTGKLFADEATYIPDSEHRAIFMKARITVLIYAAVLGAAIYSRSVLPLLFVGLPNLLGAWLMPVYGFTQHAGLEENVLDHRKNCRTVKMNLVNRFLYWNMNYHIEHHMFPQVPYYNLPRLHKLVSDDMPQPYTGLLHAWREIIPAVIRQSKDPEYFVKRDVPEPTGNAEDNVLLVKSSASPDDEGWVSVGKSELLLPEDVLRFDHAEKTYAVYRASDGGFYASAGICTHGQTHLATGKVIGCQIECPKHNGRFDVRDGSVQRKPPKNCLQTYPVKVADGQILIKVSA